MPGERKETGGERTRQERKEVGRMVRGRSRGAKGRWGVLVIQCDLGQVRSPLQAPFPHQKKKTVLWSS